ncbi:hypothetical protein UPYG_G00061690 [Umbra pygmaea]|uniref:Apolipoprotein L3 n=1 Tax=Umbra pygmaea TaxID=75934 RepID=A0ABD0X9I5_UMBPY
MAKPPPLIPKPRSFYQGNSEEVEILTRSSCGPPSPANAPCSGKLAPVAQNTRTLRQTSVPEGGSVDQGNESVADLIKMFEFKEDQNKQLMNPPIQKAPLIFDRDDPSPPIYEEVIVTKEIHMYKRRIPSTYNCQKGMPRQLPSMQPPAKNSPPPYVEKPQSLGQQGKMKMFSVSSMDEEEQADNLIKDPYLLMEWWEEAKNKSWKDLSNKLKEGEAKQFTVKAERVLNAVQLYNLLLNTHGETMKNHITELNDIADNLDKVSKGTKIAGITGGATGAVGGVAAVAGVVLAPLTFGASLALTAVGVGVAAAGGVTGASAAIANKVSNVYDRNKIEQILQDFQDVMDEIEDCLLFISMGMEHLRKHDRSTLQGVNTKTLRVFKLAEVTGMGSSSAINAVIKASGNLQGFAVGLDLYYSKIKNEKTKLRSEFAWKIRTIAQHLDEGLEELFIVKDSLLENELIF